MDDAARVSWLHRRAGFGLHPDQLDLERRRSPDDVVDDLIGQSGGADPWASVDFDGANERGKAVVAWLVHLATSPTGYVDRRTWHLHGWLVSAMDKVPPPLMIDQVRLLGERGGGSFPDLLRRLTVDRAMLVYLDGRRSTGTAPNENYGRELMELFALGIGNYTEDDVRAAARALTGWVVRPDQPSATFVSRRHDDTPQSLLGADGIHDVDTVIDAVVSHPAHPTFVASKVVERYLGDPAAGLLGEAVDALADVYSSDPRLDAMIADALRLGLDGASAPIVLDPVSWMVMAVRACGVNPSRIVRQLRPWLQQSGQIPLLAPSVAGWPSGTTWFNSSAMVARANMASAIARNTDPGESCLVAAADGDLDRLAVSLGHGEPFSPSTIAAIEGERNPVSKLTLALLCPENLVS